MKNQRNKEIVLCKYGQQTLTQTDQQKAKPHANKSRDEKSSGSEARDSQVYSLKTYVPPNWNF